MTAEYSEANELAVGHLVVQDADNDVESLLEAFRLPTTMPLSCRTRGLQQGCLELRLRRLSFGSLN